MITKHGPDQHRRSSPRPRLIISDPAASLEERIYQVTGDEVAARKGAEAYARAEYLNNHSNRDNKNDWALTARYSLQCIKTWLENGCDPKQVIGECEAVLKMFKS